MAITYAGRFAGRTAIITGGAAGIGLCIAARILTEGGKVILWDRDGAQIDRATTALGGAVYAVSVDVSAAEAVVEAMRQSIDQFGPIDVMVASAGITGPNMPGWEYPDGEWRRVVDVNLNGAFYCNKAVIPHMIERNYGRVVNMASVAGKEGNPNAAAYSASKAGVIGMTKSLAKELARTNVRVNCVTPAAVPTALFKQMRQEQLDYMLSKIPMGRFGSVEEVAALACWAASEECSFSTGAVFDISGGRATY